MCHHVNKSPISLQRCYSQVDELGLQVFSCNASFSTHHKIKKTDTFVHMLLPIHIHIYHEKRNKCEMNIVSHTNTVLVSILVILYKASNEF